MITYMLQNEYIQSNPVKYLVSKEKSKICTFKTNKTIEKDSHKKSVSV